MVSPFDYGQVYEMSGAALRELHDNLLLAFSAQAPHILNLYHQTAPLPTGNCTLASSPFYIHHS